MPHPFLCPTPEISDAFGFPHYLNTVPTGLAILIVRLNVLLRFALDGDVLWILLSLWGRSLLLGSATTLLGGSLATGNVIVVGLSLTLARSSSLLRHSLAVGTVVVVLSLGLTIARSGGLLRSSYSDSSAGFHSLPLGLEGVLDVIELLLEATGVATSWVATLLWCVSFRYAA